MLPGPSPIAPHRRPLFDCEDPTDQRCEIVPSALGLSYFVVPFRQWTDFKQTQSLSDTNSLLLPLVPSLREEYGCEAFFRIPKRHSTLSISPIIATPRAIPFGDAMLPQWRTFPDRTNLPQTFVEQLASLYQIHPPHIHPSLVRDFMKVHPSPQMKVPF